jgi:hypothetical protein
MRGSKEPKYLILGAMRSGTTVINESLELHPQLDVAYEVFHAGSAIELTNIPDIRDLLEELYGTRKLDYSPSVMLGSHPRHPDDVGIDTGANSFINDYDLTKLLDKVFERYNGLKILYYQVKRNNTLWDYLRDYENLKIIQVVRRNYLESLVSLLLSYRSGIWQVQQWGDLKEDQMVVIQPQQANRYFEYMDFVIEHYQSMFEDKSHLLVEYEEIADWDRLMKKAQGFLGIPYVPLPIKYKKRTQYHLHKIQNLAELSEYFLNTKWRWMFECHRML